MRKFKFIIPISRLWRVSLGLMLLAVLVLVREMCGKEEKEESQPRESVPFQGKKVITQITNNKIRDLEPRVLLSVSDTDNTYR